MWWRKERNIKPNSLLHPSAKNWVYHHHASPCMSSLVRWPRRNSPWTSLHRGVEESSPPHFPPTTHRTNCPSLPPLQFHLSAPLQINTTCQTHVMTLTSNPTFSAILKSLVFICIRRFHTGFDQLWVENSIHNPWLGIWRCEGQDCMHCSAPFYIRHFSILGFGCLQRVLEAICHRYRGMMVFSFQLLHFLD